MLEPLDEGSNESDSQKGRGPEHEEAGPHVSRAGKMGLTPGQQTSDAISYRLNDRIFTALSCDRRLRLCRLRHPQQQGKPKLKDRKISLTVAFPFLPGPRRLSFLVTSFAPAHNHIILLLIRHDLDYKLPDTPPSW